MLKDKELILNVINTSSGFTFIIKSLTKEKIYNETKFEYYSPYVTLSSNDLLNEDGIAFCFNSTYDDFFIEFNIYYLDTYEANDYEYAIQRQMGKFYRTKIQNEQKPEKKPSFYSMVELALAESLGRKISISKNKGKKGGVLQIEFYSDEELTELSNKLK